MLIFGATSHSKDLQIIHIAWQQMSCKSDFFLSYSIFSRDTSQWLPQLTRFSAWPFIAGPERWARCLVFEGRKMPEVLGCAESCNSPICSDCYRRSCFCAIPLYQCSSCLRCVWLILHNLLYLYAHCFFSLSLDEASEITALISFCFLFSIGGFSVNLLCRRVVLGIVEIR